MREKKIISLLAILAMMMLCAIGVQADEVTEITSNDGYTISSTGTYKLMTDITGQITVNAEVKATLDLNGKSMTSDGEAITNNGTLTIIDSVGSGSVTGTYDAVLNNGTLKVYGGKFTGEQYNGVCTANNGTTEIYGGTFTTLTEGNRSVDFYEPQGINGEIKLYGGTYLVLPRATLIENGEYNTAIILADGVITGGTFNSSDTHGVHGSGTIKGGTFNGTVNAANITIEGGKFTSTANIKNLTSISAGEYDATISDVESISGGIFNGTVSYAQNITGGTFNGTVSYAKKISDGTFNSEVRWPESITGGTLNGTIYFRNTSIGEAWDNNISPEAIVVTDNCTITNQYTSGYTICEVDGKNRIKYVGRVKINATQYNSDEGTVSKAYFVYPTVSYTSSSATLTKGTTITFTSGQATPKPGYAFKGWYTNAEGMGTPITTEQSIKDITYELNEDTTTYAVFVKETEYINAQAGVDEFLANYDTQDTFTIASETDMYMLAIAVNEKGKSFSGKTVNLIADLNFADKPYYPVGDSVTQGGVQGHYFKGTFNGNNHSISNINVYVQGYAGIFGTTSGATINDLTVKDSSFTSETATGAFVGSATSTTLNNCKSLSNTIANGWHAGGMVGAGQTKLTIKDAVVKNVTVTKPGYKGAAIVGYVCGLNLDGAEISDITTTSSGMWGAIAGHANTGTHTVKNVTVNTPSLPLIGSTYSASQTITISGNNTVTAASVLDELAEPATLNIQSGTYNVATVINKFGNDGQWLNGKEGAAVANITGGTFNGLNTVYNTITDYATANVESSLVDNGESGITTELLKQCTD